MTLKCLFYNYFRFLFLRGVRAGFLQAERFTGGAQPHRRPGVLVAMAVVGGPLVVLLVPRRPSSGNFTPPSPQPATNHTRNLHCPPNPPCRPAVRSGFVFFAPQVSIHQRGAKKHKHPDVKNAKADVCIGSYVSVSDL
jgi:hypothetical protein